MPVPKRKTSKSRRDSRSAHKGLAERNFNICSNCKAPLASHQVCKACGFYKGAKVLATKQERTLKRIELRAKTTKREQDQQNQDSSKSE